MFSVFEISSCIICSKLMSWFNIYLWYCLKLSAVIKARTFVPVYMFCVINYVPLIKNIISQNLKIFITICTYRACQFWRTVDFLISRDAVVLSCWDAPKFMFVCAVHVQILDWIAALFVIFYSVLMLGVKRLIAYTLRYFEFHLARRY